MCHRVLGEISPFCFNPECIFFSSLPKKKKNPLKFLYYTQSSLMPYTSLQVLCGCKGCIIPHGPVLKRDPALPQWVSDIYWQLKNRRIQLFPLLCLGAVEDTGGRPCLPMCSNSFLANLHNQEFQMQEKSCLAPGLDLTHCE